MKTSVKFSLIFLVLFSALSLSAQRQAPSKADRERFMSEMREYKHELIAKELDLTKEQQRDFFPLYDAMEDEIERINNETRENEQRLAENPDATELELENGARTVFEQKRAEGQIEMTYFEKFREILSPRQLLKLKNAERKWQQQLFNHHRRMSRDKAPR